EAADPQRFASEIDLITQFLLQFQSQRGSWYYHLQVDTGGDTSITQYAMLGAWAASRSGVNIPNSVLSRCAHWHLQTQQADGSFGYHPGHPIHYAGTHTMTVNGVTSL